MARSKRTRYPDASSLMMQAPMVMWMRMPLLFFEMAAWRPGHRAVEAERAVVEKIAAGFETVGKVQAQTWAVWANAWGSALSGAGRPCDAASAGLQSIMQAGIEPYARRVAGNAVRLTGKR